MTDIQQLQALSRQRMKAQHSAEDEMMHMLIQRMASASHSQTLTRAPDATVDTQPVENDSQGSAA